MSSSSSLDVEKQGVHPLGYTDEDLKLQRRLMTPFLSKKVPPIPNEEDRKPYPFRSSNYISRIFFWWLMPLMNVGYKRTLTSNDLYYLTDSMSIKTTYPKFERYLNNIIEKNKAKHLKKNPNMTQEELDALPYPKYSIVQALFLTFKWKYSFAILAKALSDIAQTLNPLLTKALINYVEKKTYVKDLPLGKGVGYSIGVAFVLAVNGILINHFLHNSITVGAHCKAILTTALLKKSFKASAETRHKYSSGKVTSLMGTDLARIDLAVGFQPFAITFPLPVIIAIVLLIVNIGVAALAGIAIFLVSLLIIGGSAKRLMAMRKSANQYTDNRVGYMREILQSMKMIKFYSWEDAYEKNVTEQRTKEVSIIFKMQTIRNFLLAFSTTLPTFTSMVAFLVLYGVSKNRSPADIFSSISLFGALSQQVMMLPMALATGADAMIGIGRVREYLQCSDIEEDTNSEEFDKTELPSDVAIKVSNATFEWEEFPEEEEVDPKGKKSKKSKKSKKEEKKEEILSEASKEVALVNEKQAPIKAIESTSTDSEPSAGSITEEVKDVDEAEYTKNVFEGFHNINFEIKKGEFIIVTGPIGSGKSSLLTALSGFMKRQQGDIGVNGSLLLCGQSWVQNATLRENVLFGLEFDEERYRDVIDVCALKDDLKSFPGGDLTEIGERGITLSGGQKARINLARAVYANKEIILFDDVLSAVDARVGKHIMDECLVDYLQDKTRILATHQLSLVSSADRVIYLNGDGTINIGTVNELMATTPGFVTLMEYSKNTEEEEEEEEENLEDKMLEAKQSNAVSERGINNAADGLLTSAEERAVNNISWTVYLDYLKAGQGVFKMFASPLALLSLIVEVYCSLFTNVWLSFWISYKFNGRSDGFYIGIYVMFTFLYIIISACTFVLMGYISTKAAKILNLRAMQKILHAPMSYIDTTPLGRIMNRFTKDTDALDNETGEQIRLFLHPTAFVIGIIILCIIYLPWFAIAVPPLAITFVCVTNYYQSSSREVKRLEAVKRSFVYNNFNEVLGGMNTIKAYNSAERFLLKNEALLDKMNEAYFIVIANQRWISIHLDLVACILALIVALLSVSRQFNISAASAGLVVTYVIQLAGLLSLILRAYTQVENEMNSVERLCHYANELVQEPDYKRPDTQPAATWPEHGVVEFDHVSLRYREGLPLVLKDLNFTIVEGEKIGICGRTGAGKSSIMTALYRLSELAEGTIKIDGVDISKLGLYELRSKLSIIPQDPVLFQGTIRKNLDPFGESDDMHLWDALRRSGLVEESHLQTIKGQDKTDKNFHKFHLDQLVEDEGSNFSLGERQLLALARALVRNSKILILDEATSSVDYETDSKIQATITREFKHCTILCIAHRLKTILTYDRILVLEQGEIEQFDEPVTLYDDEDGIFRQMCERSDIKESDFTKYD